MIRDDDYIISIILDGVVLLDDTPAHIWHETQGGRTRWWGYFEYPPSFKIKKGQYYTLKARGGMTGEIELTNNGSIGQYIPTIEFRGNGPFCAEYPQDAEEHEE